MSVSALFDQTDRVAVVTAGNGGFVAALRSAWSKPGASGSGLIPSYSAAKGAIVQLTKSMAIELAPHNIRVNAIAPGWIETDMTAPNVDEGYE